MNERSEAFRKRLSRPEKKARNWQQWIGSPTAWLALTLSSTTAFFTYFYHSDQLSVIVSTPSIMPEDDKTATVRAPGNVTFINSGTRPIVVTGFSFELIQPIEDAPEPECLGSGSHSSFSLEFEQTVIRPYDTITKPIKFASSTSSKPEDQERKILDLTGENIRRGKGKQVIVACGTFSLIVTEGRYWSKTVDLGKTALQSSYSSTSEDRSEYPAPYLIKRNRFWTEIDRDAGISYSGRRLNAVYKHRF